MHFGCVQGAQACPEWQAWQDWDAWNVVWVSWLNPLLSLGVSKVLRVSDLWPVAEPERNMVPHAYITAVSIVLRASRMHSSSLSDIIFLSI